MVRLRVAAAILTTLLLLGCQGTDERASAAVEFVEAYLRAASGGDELRGWSFLDDEVRSAMFENDINVYLAAVRAGEWTGVAWEVGNIDPEDAFVSVRLRLTGGDYPAYLIERRGSFTLATGDGDSRSFVVRFGPFGSRTLFAGGG